MREMSSSFCEKFATQIQFWVTTKTNLYNKLQCEPQIAMRAPTCDASLKLRCELNYFRHYMRVYIYIYIYIFIYLFIHVCILMFIFTMQQLNLVVIAIDVWLKDILPKFLFHIKFSLIVISTSLNFIIFIYYLTALEYCINYPNQVI